jgi:hypothetical protein
MHTEKGDKKLWHSFIVANNRKSQENEQRRVY